MERRDFLKLLSGASVAAMGGQLALESREFATPVDYLANVYEDIDTSSLEIARSVSFMSTPSPNSNDILKAFQKNGSSRVRNPGNLDHYLEKMEHFERSHIDDIFLNPHEYRILVSTFKRLGRVQNLVGHGNFNVLGFDEMVRFGHRYSSVGAFEGEELAFMDRIFSAPARDYGFLGDKVIDNLTSTVPSADRKKMPFTGHFLFRGDSEALYQKLREDIGESVVLTSGIRSVVKQTHLFLAKTVQSKGNLSRASRSLAPPGHSFHGIGDFDVGKVGFGRKNFTTEFSKTPEFARLVELGYVKMRYPRRNLLGVRYEPWHIKVA